MLEREYLIQRSSKEQHPGVCTTCCKRIGSGESRFRLGPEGILKCRSCASVDPALLKRGMVMSIIVGTLLTLINQGPEIFGGTAGEDPSLFWKIPLTYLVPFLVSWVSVMSASKVSGSGQIDPEREESRIITAAGYQA